MLPEVKSIIRATSYGSARKIVSKALNMKTGVGGAALPRTDIQSEVSQRSANGDDLMSMLDDACSDAGSDPGGMHEHLEGFPAQLREAAAIGRGRR